MRSLTKILLAGFCASFLSLSGAAKAELITTNQQLMNPDFSGNSTIGWLTSGSILFSSRVIEDQNYAVLYSKSASHSARQNLNLSAGTFNTGLIDSGQLQYDASTWQQGYSGDTDRGRLVLYFFDANNQLIQNVTLGYKDPNAITKTQLTGYVPASTRFVQFALDAVRYSGTDNNALFAHNSLTFSTEREALALYGGYFIQGEQIIPVEPDPVDPEPTTDVSSPTMAAGLFMLMLGLRRRRQS